jgi:hypothetical protein
MMKTEPPDHLARQSIWKFLCKKYELEFEI